MSHLMREIKYIGKLFMSTTAKNLLRVFYLQEGLKGLGKENKFKPQHVHMIGAGVMGGDIAAVVCSQRVSVTLQESSFLELIGNAIEVLMGWRQEY